MALPERVIMALNTTGEVIGPIEPTLDKHIAWLTIHRLHEQKPGSSIPKFASATHPNAKFVVRWMEMSDKKYQAFLCGNGIANDDAEKFEQEFADNEAELENLLSARAVNLDKLDIRKRLDQDYPR